MQRFICRVMIVDPGMLLAGFAVLLLLCPVPGQSAEQKTPAPQAAATPAPVQKSAAASTPSAPSGPAAIPVADVATQAAAVQNLLLTFTDKLARDARIETIRNSLPDVIAKVDRGVLETTTALRRHPALPTLQSMQQRWQQINVKNGEWLTELTKRSNELQDALNRLAGLQKIWALTLSAAQSSKAPGPSLQQINATIAYIVASQGSLKNQLTSVLDLQSQVSSVITKCESVMAQIAQVQQASVSGMLVQESLPIVSPELWADARSAIPAHVRSAAAAYRSDIANYLGSSSQSAPLYAAVAVLTLLFLAAWYQIREWTAADAPFSPALKVFYHPVAAALTLALFVVTSPYWTPLPATVRGTFQVLALAPMLILVRPVVPARLACGLYALAMLFAVDELRTIFSANALLGQGFLILESIAGAIVTIWFLRNIRETFGEAAGSSRLRLLQCISIFVIMVLSSGFVSAFWGYLRLARLMTPGVLASGVLAMALYASLRICIGAVAFSLRVWPLRTLRMVKEHHGMIEKRIYHLLILGAVAGFIVRHLSYVGLLEPTLSLGKTFLGTKFQRGALSISLGDILEFFLTVWAAYLLSAFIRFVLREDVYPRIGIAPGKSYAVSGLLHYLIIALGFTAAIAALGINLNKLTVLTGAFGVGIGFGLQSVVNNFVSGVILLFERPVHVGDAVEIGDLLGNVRRIGIRASTVRTRQGADIIVPNSQLITEKVTNWTLSDKLRRIDFPVGVNYSALPEKVIQVLEAVAAVHPQVLRDPPPQALFTGYGDSSINFELRAWTAQFDDWWRIRSDLAVAVYDAVHAAGMSFPFPQREVRILEGPDGGNTTDLRQTGIHEQ